MMTSAFTSAVDNMSVTREAWLRAARDKEAEAFHERLDERRAREKKEDEEEFDELVAFVTDVIASDDRITLFADRLSTYSTATLEALQANADSLADAAEERNRLLGTAHLLPDGRRVFETEDGLRVIDEHGDEVEAELATPDDLDNERPKWEDFDAVTNRHTQLATEREELLSFQDRLDEMRERMERGALTEAELDEFEDVLEDQSPSALDAYLPEDERHTEIALDAEDLAPTPAATQAPVAPVLGLDL